MNDVKFLTSDYNNNKVQYILDSKDYLSNILCNLIQKELKVKKSAVNISINYYDPTVYCPLASDNYLEFSTDPLYKEATEYNISVSILDSSLTHLDFHNFVRRFKKELYKIGFNLDNFKYEKIIEAILEKGHLRKKSFEINCKYKNKEYDKLCYVVNNLYRKLCL